MTKVVEFAPFYLKKDALVADFLSVSDKFQREFLAKQPGYVSRQLVVEDKMWSDIVVWQTMEDAQNAINAFPDSAAALAYMSFIDEEENECEIRHFSLVKSY
jgi:hypothetical protein